jgi:hypothetical protein
MSGSTLLWWPRTWLLLFAVVPLAISAGLASLASYSAVRPAVTFVEPADGATLSGSVQVVMAAENFTVEPAGEARAGAGHLHIMVDADCPAAAGTIPKDDTHLHFGQGQLAADLELEPGPHSLCLQAADGLHTALGGAGMTDRIAITVE